MEKLDVNDYGFAHLTLILLLHYVVHIVVLSLKFLRVLEYNENLLTHISLKTESTKFLKLKLKKMLNNDKGHPNNFFNNNI